MDLYTANSAYSLHAQDAKRVLRELEYGRVAKERAELQDVSEVRTGADDSTRTSRLRALFAVSLLREAAAVSGKSARLAAPPGVPTECRP